MSGLTKENVIKKRKARRKRRRIKIFRALVALVIFVVALMAIGWVSVKVYQWGSRTFGTYMEIYDGYKQRRALRAASFDPRFDGYTNVLIVGLDPGREDNGQQADLMLLLSFNHDTGDVRIITVPRYTMAAIPGRTSEEPLNSAFYYGGIPLLEQSVTGLLNVTVHHYVAVDTVALSEIVDCLGGVDMYVEADLDYDDPEGDLYIHIPKGFQHMDGDTAQKYLRFSSDDLGVLGRTKRQQIFLNAFYSRLLQGDVVAKLPDLVKILERDVTTSIESFDSAHFANLLRKMHGSKPRVVQLPGYMAPDGSGHWVCDHEKTLELVDELFPVEVNED